MFQPKKKHRKFDVHRAWKKAKNVRLLLRMNLDKTFATPFKDMMKTRVPKNLEAAVGSWPEDISDILRRSAEFRYYEPVSKNFQDFINRCNLTASVIVEVRTINEEQFEAKYGATRIAEYRRIAKFFCKDKKLKSFPCGQWLLATMKQSHFAAILFYTGPFIYKHNEILSSLGAPGGNEKLDVFWRNNLYKFLRLFISAIERLPKKNIVVYRGVRKNFHMDPKYQKEKIVTWWGISSTSEFQSIANDFATSAMAHKADDQYDTGTLFTIYAKSARDISAISFYPNEREHILLPGTKFRVIDNRPDPWAPTEIVLAEIGHKFA